MGHSVFQPAGSNVGELVKPILLFGMPRSGTTWVGKIFDSHPGTLYRHEPDSCRPLAGVPLFPALDQIERHREALNAYVASLPTMNVAKLCGGLPLFPKAYHPGLRFQLLKAGFAVAKVGEQFSRNFPILGLPTGRGYRGLRLVWKSIESLGRLGVLAGALEDAVCIHIVRHPCGQIASVLEGERHRKFHGYVASEDFGLFELLLTTPQAKRRGLTLDHIKQLGPEERAAWRWVLINEKAMEEALNNPRCMVVRYEDVCAQPEAHVRQLFKFSGLAWNVQTQDFVTSSTATHQNAYYAVFKDSLRMANRWREVLDKGRVQRIMAVVEDSLPGRLYM